MTAKHLYKIIFVNRGEVFEIFAQGVGQGALLGFVEIEEPVFGGRSKLVLDPSEEKLQREFEGVTRFHVPLHSVIRIDEVEKEGVSRISADSGAQGSVAAFPVPVFSPGSDSRKS